MKNTIYYILPLLPLSFYGQTKSNDSIIKLKEVVVAEKFRKKQIQSEVKLSCTVDEYLSTSDNISFMPGNLCSTILILSAPLSLLMACMYLVHVRTRWIQ